MGGLPEGLTDGFDLVELDLMVVALEQAPPTLWLPDSYWQEREVWTFEHVAVVGRALEDCFAGASLKVSLGDDRAHYQPPAEEPKPKPKAVAPSRYSRQLRSALAWGDRLTWADEDLAERCELIDDVLEGLYRLPEVQEP